MWKCIVNFNIKTKKQLEDKVHLLTGGFLKMMSCELCDDSNVIGVLQKQNWVGAAMVWWLRNMFVIKGLPVRIHKQVGPVPNSKIVLPVAHCSYAWFYDHWFVICALEEVRLWMDGESKSEIFYLFEGFEKNMPLNSCICSTVTNRPKVKLFMITRQKYIMCCQKYWSWP